MPFTLQASEHTIELYSNLLAVNLTISAQQNNISIREKSIHEYVFDNSTAASFHLHTTSVSEPV